MAGRGRFRKRRGRQKKVRFIKRREREKKI